MILLRKVTAAGAWKAPGHDGTVPSLTLQQVWTYPQIILASYIFLCAELQLRLCAASFSLFSYFPVSFKILQKTKLLLHLSYYANADALKPRQEVF